jgi:hypothetical protein
MSSFGGSDFTVSILSGYINIIGSSGLSCKVSIHIFMCTASIRLNISFSSNIDHFFMGEILSFGYLKFAVHNCYL